MKLFLKYFCQQSIDMFPLSLLSFASLIAIAVQSCHGIDGGAVSWWILYQQKNRAFIHYYVDNKNTEDIVVCVKLVVNVCFKVFGDL